MEDLKEEKEQRLAVANNEKLKFLEAVKDKAEEIQKSKEFIQELFKKI